MTVEPNKAVNSHTGQAGQAQAVQQRMRRFIIPSLEHHLPFIIESIGYNPQQENIRRQEGYPYYHWLQTVEGEGEFFFHDQRYVLQKEMGILTLPHVPHSYKALTRSWSTLYVTFTGLHMQGVLSSLNMDVSACYEWSGDADITSCLSGLLHALRTDTDLSSLDSTVDLYRFLTLVKKHGRTRNQPSLSNAMEKLSPLIDYMNVQYGNPEIALDDMAGMIGISIRYLNILFKRAFGVSAYTYLILLRLQKAKGIMVERQELTIREIARQVGFRDVSHFVATFRKREGTTPEKFRRLYLTDKRNT